MTLHKLQLVLVKIGFENRCQIISVLGRPYLYLICGTQLDSKQWGRSVGEVLPNGNIIGGSQNETRGLNIHRLMGGNRMEQATSDLFPFVQNVGD